MPTEDVAPQLIVVGERFREEYGIGPEWEDFVESIREYGVIQPVTVDENMNLLAGGRRVRAALEAELQLIPVVIRKVADEADAREIELVENIHRKNLTWQERARLEARIKELRGESVRGLASFLGESHGSASRHLILADALEVLPELAKCRTEDEAFKAWSKAKHTMVVRELTRRAGLQAEATPEGKKAPPTIHAYKFADANYHIGDALEGMANISPGVFNFAEVDPPYGISLKETKRYGPDAAKAVDDYTEVPEKEYAEFLREAMGQVYRVLAPRSFCVWWFGPTHYQLVRETLREIGFILHDVPAIWFKDAPGQTNHPEYNLANTYEPFFLARKGQPVLRKQGRGNVFVYPPVPAQQKIHPTERPLALMLEILELCCYPGQGMVVPFLGSGVTLRAGYRSGISGMGWDLDQDLKNRFILKAQEDAERDDHYREGGTENSDEGQGDTPS